MQQIKFKTTAAISSVMQLEKILKKFLNTTLKFLLKALNTLQFKTAIAGIKHENKVYLKATKHNKIAIRTISNNTYKNEPKL